MEKNMNVDETMVLPINIQQVKPQPQSWIRVFLPVLNNLVSLKTQIRSILTLATAIYLFLFYFYLFLFYFYLFLNLGHKKNKMFVNSVHNNDFNWSKPVKNLSLLGEKGDKEEEEKDEGVEEKSLSQVHQSSEVVVQQTQLYQQMSKVLALLMIECSTGYVAHVFIFYFFFNFSTLLDLNNYL